MAVQQDQVQITPYTSTVPTVQIPQEAMNIQPSQPLQGQFGRKGTGALAVGDALLKGFLAGHEAKAQRKAAEARATISAADAATESAYQKYQDAISSAKGDVNNPEAKAAYDAYMGIFNQAKEAKAKFVLPETGKKGKSGAGGEKGEKKQGFGGIKDFFEANPHIVPQIALMTMQPKAPGLNRESRLQNLEEQNLLQQQKLGAQNLQINDQTIKQNDEQHQRQQTEQKVNEAGGYDAVLSSHSATPELATAARRMRAEQFDKQGPLEKMKMEGLNEIQSGASKDWTPEKRMMYASVGVGQMPQAVQTTGKNGHVQQVLVDPTTNQPMAGSKPLDLGPPQWAAQFYAKRAADRADIHHAVQADPAAYGVQLGQDPKANKAAIEARSEQIYIKASFGIQSLADMYGRTGYEVQRDNEVLQGLVKEVQLNGKTSWLDQKPPILKYGVDTKGAGGEMIKAGQPVQVGRQYFAQILNQFVTSPSENGGIMGFRDAPANPDGKSPQTLEAERKFLYQFVKNKLITEKGKSALTPEQADAFLARTAIGKPVTDNTPSAAFGPPPQYGGAQSAQASGNPFGPPPQFGQQDWTRGTGITDADLATQ